MASIKVPKQFSFKGLGRIKPSGAEGGEVPHRDELALTPATQRSKENFRQAMIDLSRGYIPKETDKEGAYIPENMRYPKDEKYAFGGPVMPKPPKPPMGPMLKPAGESHLAMHEYKPGTKHAMEGKVMHGMADGGVVGTDLMDYIPTSIDTKSPNWMGAKQVAKNIVSPDSGNKYMFKHHQYAEGGPVDALMNHLQKHNPHLVHNMKDGGKVPGEAKVAGDSYKNDTVKALLSPGEIVLPRHITQGDKPGDRAKRFVEALMDLKDLKKS